ncbi:MAG: monovalent cation/H(+) antiporter subunit G [Ignisphaera sp.]
MLQLFVEAVELVGIVLLLIGGFFELTGAIGVLRLPNFFSRIHAATASAIGGTVVPLIGLALVALAQIEMGWERVYLASLCIVSAILILLVAPAGSQALMRAACMSRYREIEDDEAEATEREYR